jgi:hypothetical protein
VIGSCGQRTGRTSTLAEPALVLRHFSDPLEVDGRSPVARADLGNSAGE